MGLINTQQQQHSQLLEFDEMILAHWEITYYNRCHEYPYLFLIIIFVILQRLTDIDWILMKSFQSFILHEFTLINIKANYLSIYQNDWFSKRTLTTFFDAYSGGFSSIEFNHLYVFNIFLVLRVFLFSIQRMTSNLGYKRLLNKWKCPW